MISLIKHMSRTNIALLASAVGLWALAVFGACGLMFTSGFMISLAACMPATVLALHVPSLFVRIFGLGKPIVQYVERLTAHDWVLRATSVLRVKTFDSLSENNVAPIIAAGSLGDALNSFSVEIEGVQNIFLRTIIPLCGLTILYLAVVVAFCAVDISAGFYATLILAIVAFGIPALSYVASSKICTLKEAYGESLTSVCLERMMNLFDWQLSGRKNDFASEVELLFNAQNNLRKKVSRNLRLLAILRECLCAASICLVLVWAQEYFQDANWIAAFVLCAFPLLEAFAIADESVLALASIKGKKSCTLKTDNFMLCDGYACELSYEDFRQMLRQGKPIVNIGEKVAIIGPSGAGKTTLLSIFKDDAKDIDTIASINQDSYVFGMPLRDNLKIANTRASDKELEEALKSVKLPFSLDKSISEDGIGVSGGERQRIALARVLLYDADLVLLDEPTQGLDENTARTVMEEIILGLSDKTVICATHDIFLLDLFDRVFEVNSGKIREVVYNRQAEQMGC